MPGFQSRDPGFIVSHHTSNIYKLATELIIAPNLRTFDISSLTLAKLSCLTQNEPGLSP